MPVERSGSGSIPWEEAGVVSTANSPFCRLKPVPIRAVRMGDGFWRPRMEVNARVTLGRQMRKFRELGYIDNFLRVYGRSGAGYRAMGPAPDSDVYKWIEAAPWTLQTLRLPEVESMLNEAIEIIEPAQGGDGYLNTRWERAGRWTDIGRGHELYCAGHLFQAAVAHHRSTGSERLLSMARRFADHICDVFGPGKREAHPGHPEVEMALVELYRETGVRRYLDLAGYFIDHAGGRGMREIVGHAVRALYFCCGMADYYAETGDKAHLDALEGLWRSMTETKMYVTGAVGGETLGESFGREFELPNEDSYAETCAAIASAFWNWRMLGLRGEARFADLMELIMYNSVLSGVSLDGERYFYVNPHASSGRPTDWGGPWSPNAVDRVTKKGGKGVPTRQEWFQCACCPPNVARILAAMPGYFYSTSEEGVWVHLYDNNALHWHLQDGTGFSLTQRTDYPWDGKIEVEVSPEAEREFSLYLRIPGWCREASVTVDGSPVPRVPRPGGYHEVRRRWRRGSRVVLDLAMPPALMVSNPMAAENRGSVAVKRGPVVYCLEGVDNPGISVREARLRLDPESPSGGLKAEFRPDLLGGVTMITAKGAVPAEEWGPLYRPLDTSSVKTRPVTLRAIPYYAWDNRGPSEMTVWIQIHRD